MNLANSEIPESWVEALTWDFFQSYFALNNLAIFFAYMIFSIKLIPVLPLRRITALSGHAFFALCALTHLEHSLHAYWNQGDLLWTTWHGQIIHALQAVAVWMFFIGFLRDVKLLMTQHNLLLAEKARNGG